MCMYTCTLGASLTLSTLMLDFFHIRQMDFSVLCRFDRHFVFNRGTADEICKVRKTNLSMDGRHGETIIAPLLCKLEYVGGVKTFY